MKDTKKLIDSIKFVMNHTEEHLNTMIELVAICEKEGCLDGITEEELTHLKQHIADTKKDCEITQKLKNNLASKIEKIEKEPAKKAPAKKAEPEPETEDDGFDFDE